MQAFRSLPSVDQLLKNGEVKQRISTFGIELTTNAIRASLDRARDSIRADGEPVDNQTIIKQISDLLEEWTNSSIFPLINATGVIIHTNLGRAPLSKEAILALKDVAEGYSNLEYDVEKGKRGSRLIHSENLLIRLTGAESAMVVNNNASAVLLILTALARRRRVLIARSQLIEIGGGFRIPDVMNQSGAKLVEIGTTNRVHLSDYEIALEEQPIKLVMRAHRSNFNIVGFTAEPNLEEIVAATHKHNVPVIDDLGSGTLLDTAEYGLGHEPTIQESLDAGADLVCFSGDKLLGGPQAGIIVGRKDMIDKLKKHPLARAIRSDKLALAALSETLVHYIKGDAISKIPIWQMIGNSLEVLDQRASMWMSAVGEGEVIDSVSTVGGGSLPGKTLPSKVLAIDSTNPEKDMKSLRETHPPIIGRIKESNLLFDPRTVLPDQDELFIQGIKQMLTNR